MDSVSSGAKQTSVLKTRCGLLQELSATFPKGPRTQIIRYLGLG